MAEGGETKVVGLQRESRSFNDLDGVERALGWGEERLARIDLVRSVRQAVAAAAARDDGEVG